MPLKKFKILFIAFSLVGCAGSEIKKVTVCVSDPIRGGFDCVDPNGARFFLGYGQSNNFVGFSPVDFNQVLLQCLEK
jgi:hypothetical protein